MRILLISTVLLQAGRSASSPGMAGAPLLAQPVGARPLALGAAYVALADDALAMMWNPAGSVHLRSPEVALVWQGDPGEVEYGYLLCGLPLPAGQAVSLGVASLRTGDLSFEDSAGESHSADGESDVMAAVGYGVALIPFMAAPDPAGLSVSAGMTVKFLRTSPGDGTVVWTPAADLATLAAVPVAGGAVPLRVGIAWQNAGARFGAGSAPVASPVRLGLAQTLREGPGTWTTFTVEALRFAARSRIESGAGVEQVWRGAVVGLAARAGYRVNVDLPGPTAGIGIRWNRFVLDYGLATLAELGFVHRVTLRVRLE